MKILYYWHTECKVQFSYIFVFHHNWMKIQRTAIKCDWNSVESCVVLSIWCSPVQILLFAWHLLVDTLIHNEPPSCWICVKGLNSRGTWYNLPADCCWGPNPSNMCPALRTLLVSFLLWCLNVVTWLSWLISWFHICTSSNCQALKCQLSRSFVVRPAHWGGHAGACDRHCFVVKVCFADCINIYFSSRDLFAQYNVPDKD